MNIYTPYTYLIGWSKLNWWYYGVRYARNCHVSDLWSTYFTSSKEVAIIRDMYGEPDIIQIRRTFKDQNKARMWEHKVLKRMKVIHNLKWLNKHNGKCFTPNRSEQHKNNISKALKGKVKSKEHIRKNSESNKGKKRTPEQILNQKIARDNYIKNRTAEDILKMSLAQSGEKNSMYGKKQSQKMIDSIAVPITLGNKTYFSQTSCMKETGLSLFIILNYTLKGIIPTRRKKTIQIFRNLGIIQ